MYIPKVLREDFRYRRLVAQVGDKFASEIIVPGILKLVQVMFKSERSPFFRHKIRSERFTYYPTYTEVLEKRLVLMDEIILNEIRDVLYLNKDNNHTAAVYMDRLKVDVNFTGDKVVIEHPYLSRLRRRHLVIFHVSNHSLRIELK